LGLFDLFRARQPLPPADWQAHLEQAQQAMEALHYHAAAALLAPLADEPRPDPAVLPLLPAVLGMLGECWFQSGQVDRAVVPTLRALELVRPQGSAEEQIAFLGNLYEIHRYRGDGEQAAQCAEAIAEILDSGGRESRLSLRERTYFRGAKDDNEASLSLSDQADRYRRQARLVRAGEPLNRVVVDLAGVRFELDEILQGRPGPVRFLFERNRLTLRSALVRIEEAERLSNSGRFGDALTLLEEAVSVDPFSPEAPYRAGLVLIYLERYLEAIDAMTACEERAPGWFLCRPARWLAEQLEQGAASYDSFVAWHALEEGPLPAEAKIALAERSLASAPGLALLHLLHGKSLKARNAPVLAGAAFRRGLNLAVQADVRTRLLVELASVVESGEEKRALLGQAIEENGDLIAVATARVVLAFD
jgi:tetratricopeptide (TPR) repeat protein